MKKIISIILTLVFCTTFISACAAQQDDLTITMQIGNPVMTVNGEEKAIDEQGTAPVIIDNRTLLPVRAIVEEIGGGVAWDEETRTVLLGYKDDIIILEADNHTAYLNESKRELDVAPTVINDRTMLPIRFIANGFGFDVDWNEDAQTVTITLKDEGV